MEIKFFGYEIYFGKEKKPEKNMADRAKMARDDRSFEIRKKLIDEVEKMEKEGVKFSEYRLQKRTGISINTIKKNRKIIQQFRDEIAGKHTLFG